MLDYSQELVIYGKHFCGYISVMILYFTHFFCTVKVATLNSFLYGYW